MLDTTRLVRYLRGLKAHNAKPWFDAHREEYDELRREFFDFVQQTILLLAKVDPAVKHVTAKEAIYRINRDIRFSHDKRPYKTNFGAGIGPGGKKGEIAGYHLHIDADGQVMIAGGMYMMTPQQLGAVRDSIVRRPGQLRKIITAPALKKVFGGIDTGNHLQRPPRGFAPDYPDIKLIKLKSYFAWTEWPVKSTNTKTLPAQIAKKAAALYPLISYLRETAA